MCLWPWAIRSFSPQPMSIAPSVTWLFTILTTANEHGPFGHVIIHNSHHSQWAWPLWSRDYSQFSPQPMSMAPSVTWLFTIANPHLDWWSFYRGLFLSAKNYIFFKIAVYFVCFLAHGFNSFYLLLFYFHFKLLSYCTLQKWWRLLIFRCARPLNPLFFAVTRPVTSFIPLTSPYSPYHPRDASGGGVGGGGWEGVGDEEENNLISIISC